VELTHTHTSINININLHAWARYASVIASSPRGKVFTLFVMILRVGGIRDKVITWTEPSLEAPLEEEKNSQEKK